MLWGSEEDGGRGEGRGGGTWGSGGKCGNVE